MKKGYRPDGIPCFLLQVEQTVTDDQFAAALAYKMVEPDGDDLVNMTRSRAEEILLDALTSFGSEQDYRCTETSIEWDTAIVELYERQYQLCLTWVRELYPHLDSTKGGPRAD